MSLGLSNGGGIVFTSMAAKEIKVDPKMEGIKQTQGWELEVYRGVTSKKNETQQEDEDEHEFDLDEEESVQASRTMAIGVFHSQKSYNPQALFADMLKAWGLLKLASVEKIGDYLFKIEFTSEAEKTRVLEGGGPWRHKGDALIVVYYDGLLIPSEINIHSLGLWVRFYDLPPAMM
jgi:hypothetical protein